MDLSPLYISMKTAGLATIITFVLGVYAARYIRGVKRFQGIIDGIITLPLVLPPTVVGFFLLLLLGRNSFIGQFLNLFGINIIFSWPATVITATVVSFPLMYRTTRGAFEQIDKDLIAAARTLGMSEERIFWKIIIPLARPGIMAGAILSFARALGEFGATIMLAGNIPGKTQTMSTAIYSSVQANDQESAFIWAFIIIIFSLAVMVLMNYWLKKQRNITG